MLDNKFAMRVFVTAFIISAFGDSSYAETVIIDRSDSSGATNIQSGPGSSANTGSIVIDGEVVSTGDSGVKGSGKQITEKRLLSSFRAVEVRAGAEVVLHLGQVPQAIIRADDNIAPLISMEVRGGTLVISAEKSFSTRQPVEIEIKAPQIASVTAEGSGDVAIDSINTSALDLTIAGSGDLDAEGQVGQLAAVVTGSGSLGLGDLKAQSVRITIDGSGDAVVSASDELIAEINGSGNITYLGQPKEIKKTINGAGEIVAGG